MASCRAGSTPVLTRIGPVAQLAEASILRIDYVLVRVQRGPSEMGVWMELGYTTVSKAVAFGHERSNRSTPTNGDARGLTWRKPHAARQGLRFDSGHLHFDNLGTVV